MNTGVLRVLKGVLWVVCASHILIGAGIMLSGTLQQKVAGLYGAQVDWTPQLIYILRPLGAFMFMLGVVGIAAARDPIRYSVIGYAFVGVLLIRVVQRIIFRGEIEQIFHIGPVRNLTNAISFLVLAVVLAALLFAAGRRSEATAPIASPTASA